MPLIGNELVRIDLPAEGEYVEVKAKLSRGDRIEVQKALVKGARITGTENIDLDAPEAMEAAEFAVLDVVIRSIYVSVREGEDPVKVDPTPANIRQLDEASIDCIKERLNDLYPEPRSEAERRNLSGNGARSRKQGAALLRN